MPGPWDHLTDEEKLENGDYIQELRFGGSDMTDEEIKQQVYDSDDDGYTDYMNELERDYQ